MVHTQAQREAIFKADLEDIKGYLAKRFKLDIRNFKIHKGKIIAVIAYKNEIEIVTAEPPIQTTIY